MGGCQLLEEVSLLEGLEAIGHLGHGVVGPHLLYDIGLLGSLGIDETLEHLFFLGSELGFSFF